MPASSVLSVHGLADLQRAFRLADDRLAADLRTRLESVAEPVRVDAEARAVTEIRNLSEGDPWQRMRAVARQNLVYVAPVERGRNRRSPGRHRPNLAGLLMDRAMQPALEAKAGEVEERMGRLLDDMSRVWGSA